MVPLKAESGEYPNIENTTALGDLLLDPANQDNLEQIKKRNTPKGDDFSYIKQEFIHLIEVPKNNKLYLYMYMNRWIDLSDSPNIVGIVSPIKNPRTITLKMKINGGFFVPNCRLINYDLKNPNWYKFEITSPISLRDQSQTRTYVSQEFSFLTALSEISSGDAFTLFNYVCPNNFYFQNKNGSVYRRISDTPLDLEVKGGYYSDKITDIFFAGQNFIDTFYVVFPINNTDWDDCCGVRYEFSRELFNRKTESNKEISKSSTLEPKITAEIRSETILKDLLNTSFIDWQSLVYEYSRPYFPDWWTDLFYDFSNVNLQMKALEKITDFNNLSNYYIIDNVNINNPQRTMKSATDISRWVKPNINDYYVLRFANGASSWIYTNIFANQRLELWYEIDGFRILTLILRRDGAIFNVPVNMEPIRIEVVPPHDREEHWLDKVFEWFDKLGQDIVKFWWIIVIVIIGLGVLALGVYLSVVFATLKSAKYSKKLYQEQRKSKKK